MENGTIGDKETINQLRVDSERHRYQLGRLNIKVRRQKQKIARDREFMAVVRKAGGDTQMMIRELRHKLSHAESQLRTRQQSLSQPDWFRAQYYKLLREKYSGGSNAQQGQAIPNQPAGTP